jgi:hypothetical protein
MITAEERESLILEAIERTLLAIPSIIGSLVTNQIAMVKNSKEFYLAHPEFVNHKDVVASVIEFTEGSNPFINRLDLLDKAVPKIRERISEIKRLGVTKPSSKPDLGEL